jgi:hypothetical protein
VSIKRRDEIASTPRESRNDRLDIAERNSGTPNRISIKLLLSLFHMPLSSNPSWNAEAKSI